MIGRDEAGRLIEYSSRCMHGVLTGRIMAALAEGLVEDVGLWETVGLLHDLDYDQTHSETSRHGVLGAEALKGRLPEEAPTP